MENETICSPAFEYRARWRKVNGFQSVLLVARTSLVVNSVGEMRVSDSAQANDVPLPSKTRREYWRRDVANTEEGTDGLGLRCSCLSNA